MNVMESQNERILKHLRKYGQLTSIIALNNYHIPYLPARIHDLRKMGYDIRAEWITTSKRKYRKYVYNGDNKKP